MKVKKQSLGTLINNNKVDLDAVHRCLLMDQDVQELDVNIHKSAREIRPQNDLP